MAKLAPVMAGILGTVVGAYFGFLQLGAILSVLVQAAVSLAFKEEPDAPFIGWDNNQTDYDPLAPMKVPFGEGRMGGRVLYKQTSTNRNNMWLVIAFGPGPIQDLPTLWMGPEPVRIPNAADGSVQGKYASNLNCWAYLGDPDQTVNTNLQAAFPHEWTAQHRLRGLVYVVLNLTYNANLYGRGVPNPSVSYKGLNRIADTRTGAVSFTRNPIMGMRHMLMNQVWGGKAKASDFDVASLKEEADHCDHAVPVPPRSFVCGYRAGRPFTANATTNVLSFTNGFADDTAEGGFRLGDPVKVGGGGTLPSPLVSGTVYYAIPATNAVGSFSMRVAATRADAMARNAIDLTTAGSGERLCMPASYRLWMFETDCNVINVNIANDWINIRGPANAPTRRFYRTGQKVQFYVPSGTLPAPLAVNTDYWLYADGSVPILYQNARVCTSLANAEAGTFINITTNGTAGGRMRFLGVAGTVTASAATHLITLLEEKGYQTGDRVWLGNTGGALPAPLQPGRGYYWIRVSATTGRLAETLWKARHGRHITLTDAGSGTHTIESERYEREHTPDIPTGSTVRLLTTEEGTIGGGISLATDYHWISRGPSEGELAATLADAYAGNPIINSSAPVDDSTIHTGALTKQPRFTMDGHFQTDKPIGEVLQAMLTSISGYADPSGGMWRLLCARYRGPHLTLTKDDIFGEVTLTTLLTADKRTNVMKGTYQAAVNLDEAADLPVLEHADGLAEDGDIRLEESLPLPFTNTEPMGLRLLEIELERRRRQKILEITTDLAAGWPIALADSVIVDAPALGSDTYECLSWGLRMDESEQDGPPLPMVPLTLRQNDHFIYRD